MRNLEETLVKILEKAMEVATQTGEFVVDKAPELLRQFYLWHLWENILTILLFPITLIIIYYLYILLSKPMDDDFSKKNDIKIKDRYMGEFVSVVFYAFSVFLLLSIVIFTLIAIYDLVFLTVAPDLYLIEYFIK